MFTVQQLIMGLAIGCVYSLIAIGFSMVFQAMGLLHFALGEMVMLGALLGYTLSTTWKLSYLAAFILGTSATGLMGVLLEKLTLYPLRRRGAPRMNMIIATIGLSIALQNLGMLLWGAQPLVYAVSRWGFTVFLGLQILNQYFYIFLFGLLLMGGLHLFFHHTRTGISLRAAAQDPLMARLMGIRVDRTITLTFAISSALGAAAGILLAPIYYASFDMGRIGLKSFAAAVLGGFGNLYGAMVGGLLLGILEVFSANLLSSSYKDAVAFGLMIVLLLFLPTGLFRVKDLG